jgi:hypothetical protein
MIKEGEKLLCIKDMYNNHGYINSIGGYHIHKKGSYYIINIIYDNDVYLSTENENVRIYNIKFGTEFYLYDYFIDIKKERKLKLEKINEKRG